MCPDQNLIPETKSSDISNHHERISSGCLEAIPEGDTSIFDRLKPVISPPKQDIFTNRPKLLLKPAAQEIEAIPKPRQAIESELSKNDAVEVQVKCSEDDALPSEETRLRETLFQVERLMLNARPYDSIGFFRAQKEVMTYLGLGRDSVVKENTAPNDGGSLESFECVNDDPNTETNSIRRRDSSQSELGLFGKMSHGIFQWLSGRQRQTLDNQSGDSPSKPS